MISVLISIVICLSIPIIGSAYDWEDFCYSYLKNGFEIDLTFRTIDKVSGKTVQLLLIIDESHWPLEITNEKELQIQTMLPGHLFSVNWTKKYSLAFNFATASVNDIKNEFFIGFWSKNNKYIDLFSNITILTDNTFVDSIKLNDTDFEPTFFAQTQYMDNNSNQLKNILCFGEQTLIIANRISPEDSIYRRKYQCYYFESNGNGFKIIDMNRLVETEMFRTMTKLNIPTNKNTILNYSHKNKILALFSVSDDYYFLYEFRKTIHYCIGYSNFLFNLECKTGLKLLIDCSQNKEPDQTTQLKEQTEIITKNTKTPEETTQTNGGKQEDTSYPWLWIFVGLIVILVVIVAIIILLFTYNQKSKFRPIAEETGTDIRFYDSSVSDSTVKMGTESKTSLISMSKTKSISKTNNIKANETKSKTKIPVISEPTKINTN